MAYSTTYTRSETFDDKSELLDEIDWFTHSPESHTTADIIDDETGEVMFSIDNGRITYIQTELFNRILESSNWDEI